MGLELIHDGAADTERQDGVAQREVKIGDFDRVLPRIYFELSIVRHFSTKSGGPQGYQHIQMTTLAALLWAGW